MGAAGPLAFIGGAEWQPGCDFGEELLGASRSRDVVVITAAAAYENPDNVFGRASNWFGGLGVSVVDAGVLTRSDAYKPSAVDAVRSAGIVYIADGSAMHLRSVLKDSPLFEAMESAWLDGATIAGSSAGAMVMSDPMIDPRGGAFTLGLGLARRFAAVTHWEKWTSDMSRRMSHLSPAGVVIAEIEERTALVRWPDGTWQSLGAGGVRLVCDDKPLDVDALESLVETSPRN